MQPDEPLDYKRIIQLCTILVFSLAGFGIIAPILPLIQAFGEISTSQLGFFVSSYALARVLINVPGGALVDRYSSNLIIIAGTGITVAGMLISAMAPTFFFLVAGRVLTGLGSGLAGIAITTEMLLLANTSRRASVMSYQLLARRAGISIFPFVGGALAVLFSWRAVFYFCAALNILAIFIACKLPSRKRKKPDPTGREETQDREKPSVQSYGMGPMMLPTLYFIAFAMAVNRIGLERTNIPLLGDLIGLDSLRIGITLSISSAVSLVAVFLGGRIADGYGRKLIMQVGLMVIITASALFVFVNDFTLYFIVNLLFGLASFTVILPMVMATDLSHSVRVGQRVARIRLFSDAGKLAGPVLLGWAMDLFGFNISVSISMSFLLLGLIMATLFLKTGKSLQGISRGEPVKMK